MRKITSVRIAACVVGLMMAGSGWAQDNPEGTKQAQAAKSAPTGQFYHLDFLVKEVDNGKIINSRTYSTSITPKGFNSIRAGSRVPISIGTGPNLQYMDLGVNFDCSDAREVDGKLALRVQAEVSSIPQGEQTTQSQTPVLRQNKWSADVIVPIGKPTMIFSSDDVAGKGKMEIELTATLAK